MPESRDFLFEIGVEELPASAARAAVEQAGPAARKALAHRGLAVEDGQIRVLVSPRRIAVIVSRLPERQETVEKAERGPATKAAFDDSGAPTKAAEGFARSKGLSVDDLEVREHKGQEFVFAVRREEGGPTLELLPGICTEILEAFAFPKTMRWDDSGMRFSRPVRWLVAKFGEATVDFAVGNLRSSAMSRGHRFLGESDLEIASADSYSEQLRGAMVIADHEERRKVINEGLEREAAALDATFFDPAEEMEEVIFLVENPGVQRGSFREEHLRLPEEVLVTAMQSHQRYFPLRGADGDLIAAFLHVMNGDPAQSDVINEGNERVLEGRLEDAEFSYDKDLGKGIEAMRAALGDVVFHKRLGTLAMKTERLEALAETLAAVTGAGEKDRDAAVKAAGLAKADLVSIMVQEFPTLEGSMGAVYAAIDGFHADISAALREQYLPRISGGALPETLPGALLAISDKVDNLVGAFAVDESPTGSRDPYGLRRAAAGIFEICRDRELDFDLVDILAHAYARLAEQDTDINRDGDSVTEAVFEFVNDRIQQRLVESGFPAGVVEAARAAGLRSPVRFGKLVAALESFRATPGFEELHTAYFRTSKIAAKAGGEQVAGGVEPSLFEDDAEQALLEAVERLEEELAGMLERDDFAGALAVAATIRPVVDAYFDAVMIMAEDAAVRANRLALVSRTAAVLQTLGDPMLVAAAPKSSG